MNNFKNYYNIEIAMHPASFLSSIRYDSNNERLYLTYRKDGKIFYYSNVTAESINEVLKVRNGSYILNNIIRNPNHPATFVKKIDPVVYTTTPGFRNFLAR